MRNERPRTEAILGQLLIVVNSMSDAAKPSIVGWVWAGNGNTGRLWFGRRSFLAWGKLCVRIFDNLATKADSLHAMMQDSWDDEPFDDEWWESPEAGAPEQPRDAVVDEAKRALFEFLEVEGEAVFYQRQLEVLFEKKFFHWITAHALSELADEGRIACETLVLPGTGNIKIYRNKGHRYWRRQADEIVDLVGRFSKPEFTRALGEQGELMFDAALPRVGFVPKAEKVKAYFGREWTESAHDLDRVFECNGVAYGVEIKNTLGYMDRSELYVKIRMCKHLGLRPLFIVRMAPKSYINDVFQAGGFTLVFKYQLYPFGRGKFAEEVRGTLRLPVDCPARIADGTVGRLLNWHRRRGKEG